ncbi:G2/M phase-specific E3 ubiquitin-protein ligase-like [Salvelinus fontinalis]|uniref:G2/M phase-specific E3 ubiquitin-protein ligase-like n=1 Tax=Salvelinus fontinalis TaxID=8038 RepID=UPI0024860E26|nr:G2/M phase-specific E3 ubiquitin-protein ligase-like [Salvelinus fontinalis]
MSSNVDSAFAPDANQINLRDNVYDCAMRGLKRARFHPEAKINIVFRDADGKGAADEGGPSREFLRLLMSAIHSSAIFEGPDWHKCLSCNSQALYDVLYKQMGRMIAVCLVHGGVEPQNNSERLYRQVCGLQSPVPELKEIAEYDFREKLEKIQLAQTVDEAQSAVMEASEQLVMLGSVRYIRTLESDDLEESATKFYLESRLRDALEQFKEGLECLGLLPYKNRHSSLFRED